MKRTLTFAVAVVIAAATASGQSRITVFDGARIAIGRGRAAGRDTR
jgi:hypothetical protein